MIDVIKMAMVIISCLGLVIWYTACWMCTKNDKFDKFAFGITLALAGVALIDSLIVAVEM